MAKEVILDWEHHPYKKSRGVKDVYLYALSIGEELLYIGQAYKSRAKSEMCANASRKGFNRNDLVQWFGRITDPTYNKTKTLINDIENYLIYWYQPRFNKNKKTKYTGRKELHVVNRDFPFFRINLALHSVFSNDIKVYENRITAIRDLLKQYFDALIEKSSEDDGRSIYEISYATIRMRIEYEVNGHGFVNIYYYTKNIENISDIEKKFVKQIITCFIDNL
jgi:hypothetical protein